MSTLDDDMAEANVGKLAALRDVVALRAAVAAGEKMQTALLRVRTAWELYRSGGATLEEITPLMDEAVAQAEMVQARPTIPEVEAKSPAGNNVLPRELAKIGQAFRFDGKIYRVKSFEQQYAVLVQIDRDGNFVSDGSPGKLMLRVEGTDTLSKVKEAVRREAEQLAQVARKHEAAQLAQLAKKSGV